MSSYSTVFFSLLLISSIAIASSFQSSFANEIVATGTGFEDSSILELKSNRGNTANIDTVRIWVSGENEFKSFKTEQGWMGKKELNGVIEFNSQNDVTPGESVKFGIKTTIENPIINWKAVDSSGKIISSASTKITTSDPSGEESVLNQAVEIGIKENSYFRFIPENPSSDSDFRVVGENFIPNQSLDFYIENKLQKSIKSDSDGKILFTSKVPIIENDERIEFILRDSGGSEKLLSLRIETVENREIAAMIKLSLGNTPQQVKRGDVVTLEGTATPNTTLTMINKHLNGDILNINTIQVGFDGKWNYDNLISPQLDLGQISIEINDGKNTVLRNIEVISAKLINISTENTIYDPGDIVSFEGSAIPDTTMSIIVEDAIGAEIISRSVLVDEIGKVKFNIEIPRGSVEGTYILLAFQNNEEGVAIFGVGQEPEPILIVRATKLNFSTGEDATISIQGEPNAQVAIIIIDSADREKISESINLGPDGRELYTVDTNDLATGAYTFDARRGESTGSAMFTIGLTKGSGVISVQTTRDEYKPGDQILILGNTGATNVLLDVTISNSNGNVIKKIETFSDKFGVFKIDNFRIPNDAESGEWKIDVKSGGNFSNTVFGVSTEDMGLTILTDKSNYERGEFINISGSGARMSATISMSIYDFNKEVVTELNITAKGDGEFVTIWQIPVELESGEYEINADDGKENKSIIFTIN